MRYLTILLFILFFIFFFRPITTDGDFYHHLNTGKYVIENAFVPRVDEWSFTANGKPWIAHSWGAGVIFYLVFEIFGLLGISVLVSAIAVSTYLLMYKLLDILGIDAKLNLYLLFFNLPLLAIRFPSRPEIFSYPLILFILLLSIKKDIKDMIFLYPLIILVWANVYGANVLFGLMLLLGLMGIRFFQDRCKFTKESLKLLVAVVLSIPASLLNPNGLNTVFYYFLIPKITAMQGEWASIRDIISFAPTDLYINYQYQILVYFLYAIFYFLILIFGKVIFRKNPEWFLLGLFVIVPFVSFRQTTLAVIFSLPFIALAFQNLTRVSKKIFIVLSLITLILSFYALGKTGLVFQDWGYSDYPHKVVSFLKEKKLQGHVFNVQRIGAYLSFYLDGQVKIFQDTRDDLYLPTTVFADYLKGVYDDKNILPLLSKYGIDLVVGDWVTEGMAYQPLFYDQKWRIVYFDDRFFVALPAQKMQDFGLTDFQAIDPYAFTLAKEGREKDALEEYGKIFQNNPTSKHNRMLLAKILIRQKDYSNAKALLTQIPDEFWGSASLEKISRDSLLWEVYLESGECRELEDTLSRLQKVSAKAIFFPYKRRIVTNVEAGWSMYYQTCEKDVQKAEQFYSEFQKRNDVNPKEKIYYHDMYTSLVNEDKQN
jgi:hypothetical protein